MAADRVGRGKQTAKLTEREDEIMHRFAAGETATLPEQEFDRNTTVAEKMRAAFEKQDS